MEIFYVVLALIAIYMLYAIKSDIKHKIGFLEVQIKNLQDLVKELKQTLTTTDKPVAKPEIVQKPLVENVPVKEIIAPPVSKPVTPPQERVLITAPVPVERKVIVPPNYQRPVPKEPEPSFFERHPDLEKFIGENLINKIGIAILVLSIAYFVKYAIDVNWIKPAGRAGVGILCGAILIGFAHKLRNSYKAFSSVLVGGGIAVLYFTITLAYHQFHLFSQPVAFIILIIITLFAVGLSLLYDRQELAVIALLGGLSSPFMVSTGHANYNALFVYLLILNAGLLIIAYYKAWRILNISAFSLTVIIIAGVIYAIPENGYMLCFIYSSVFYLLFFAINIANNLRENKRFVAADFSILLTNTALYFSAGLFLLTSMQHEELRGAFCAALALVNLALSFTLFRNKKVDKNVLYLLIGITLTFISLAAPIQLDGNHITLFWASECVILYWLYLKSEIKLTKLASILIWCAMIISLLMDWENLYTTSNIYPILANRGFITSFYTAICSYILFVLVKKDDQHEAVNGVSVPKNVFLITSVILFFFSGFLEVNHQFVTRYPDGSLYMLYVTLYIAVFVYAFNYLSTKVKTIGVKWQWRAGILALSILVYLASIYSFYSVQEEILMLHKIISSHFIAHWAGALVMIATFYVLIKLLERNLKHELALITWIICGALVLFLSFEVSLICNMIFYSTYNSLAQIQTVYIKTGLPILWGVLSFVLMQLGMKRKIRILRIVSLSLFTITLAKLFLFDIKNIPAAGKIAAFFCLGILLLSISFMYQKVKHIIIEDETKPKEEV